MNTASSFLVSVIISTYNRSEYLLRSVKSVLAQTYENFELLIIDDASTDETTDVINSFLDPRIRYIRHERNKGGPAARNTGIENSKGELIAFLDDDDEWMPEKLQKQVDLLSHAPANVGLVYCGLLVIGPDGQTIVHKDIPFLQGSVYEYLLRGSGIGTVSRVLVRRSCFDKAGFFDEQLKSCQDWDMWLRVARLFDVEFIPDVLVKIYQHDAQISCDFGALIPGRIRMIEKHYDEFAHYPHILVHHLKRIGKLYFLNEMPNEGWVWFKKALKLSPWQIFKILAWLAIELPSVKKKYAKHFKQMRDLE